MKCIVFFSGLISLAFLIGTENRADVSTSLSILFQRCNFTSFIMLKYPGGAQEFGLSLRMTVVIFEYWLSLKILITLALMCAKYHLGFY